MRLGSQTVNFLFLGMDSLRHGLRHEFRQSRARQGEILFEEGEAGNKCYIIISGELELRVSGGSAHSFGAGEIIGATELLYNSSRGSSCTATTNTLCWVIEKQKFIGIAGQFLNAQRKEVLPNMLKARAASTGKLNSETLRDGAAGALETEDVDSGARRIPEQFLEEMVDWSSNKSGEWAAGVLLPPQHFAFVVRGTIKSVATGDVFGPGDLLHSTTGKRVDARTGDSGTNSIKWKNCTDISNANTTHTDGVDGADAAIVEGGAGAHVILVEEKFANDLSQRHWMTDAAIDRHRQQQQQAHTTAGTPPTLPVGSGHYI